MIKTLMRSRSIAFTRDVVRQRRRQSLSRLRWRGHDVYYRPGTTDPLVLQQVLLKRGSKAEYYLPPHFRPEVILDIGSNIGASIVYFRDQFPNARIFGFEPHPDTFAVLKKNVTNLPLVWVFHCGLGSSNNRITLPAESINFGGFSTSASPKVRSQHRDTVECEIRRVDEVLHELGITRADLIKIDCEGAEADVFAALPAEILQQCQWIVGELHDDSAFELLAKLAPHFDLDLKKRLFNPLFRFHAANRSNSRDLRRDLDIDALQR
jgi:FkbM family methyltransferase